MIWFFIAGFISGWVGMMLFAGWWIRKHAVPMVKIPPDSIDEMVQELHTKDFKTCEEFLRRMDEIEKGKGEKSDD